MKINWAKKVYSYLRDDDSGYKKSKGKKKCATKQKLKYENYKNFLEANQSENKINYLENNAIDVDSPK